MATFDSRIEYNLQNIRGIPQNPTFNVDIYAFIIDNFETNPGDTFITTYVKSGTTWTQQIVHLLLRCGEPGGNHSESIPWLESLSSDSLSPTEAPTWTLEKINKIKGPRFFKSHGTVDHLPRGAADIKVIYVARNPKDTVVSLYHHAKSRPEFGYSGDFETFCGLFLDGNVENGSWFDHVLQWYKECQNQPDTHIFLMYEEIYENPVIAVQLLADLLEIQHTDEVYSKVAHHSAQFEQSRNSPLKVGIGGWRNYFTVALSESFDEVYLARMKGSGLRFNFGPNAQGKEVYM